MPPRVLEGGDQNQGREFSPLERMFICKLKMEGKKYPNIARLFSEKFGKSPPTRDGAHKMLTKLTTQGTVMTTRKGNSGPKFKVRTARNIELVRRALERASTRTPGQPGPSARRHTGNISKSSYNRITRKDLRLKPYKIMRLHKVTDQQTAARMKMGRLLARKPAHWYMNLCVSDEAWFTLSGHVFNRQNTVCYSPAGEGVPGQWISEAKQGDEKVMVFCLLHGSGHKFGPFFLSSGKVTQFTYKELLETKVFPVMKEKLGQAKFRRVIWQQDGAKPHQARMVMSWLDTIFKERMLALNCVRGDTWAPSSPDCNPCDFFLWGYLKGKVYQPLPNTLMTLKRKIKIEFDRIPDIMVQKAVFNMKKRGELMVAASGKQFEGRRQ